MHDIRLLKSYQSIAYLTQKYSSLGQSEFFAIPLLDFILQTIRRSEFNYQELNISEVYMLI
jgi:hypothetical protein